MQPKFPAWLAALISFLVGVVACLLFIAQTETAPDRRVESCETWAVENGLEGTAITLACEVGPGSRSDQLTEAEYHSRVNSGLQDLHEILDSVGGL